MADLTDAETTTDPAFFLLKQGKSPDTRAGTLVRSNIFNSPTAFFQKPDGSSSKARRLSFNGPTAQNQWPVRFQGRANGLLRWGRRGIWGGLTATIYRLRRGTFHLPPAAERIAAVTSRARTSASRRESPSRKAALRDSPRGVLSRGRSSGIAGESNAACRHKSKEPRIR